MRVCPGGKFKGKAGTEGCANCLSGQYREDANAAELKCKDCPSGKFQSAAGKKVRRLRPDRHCQFHAVRRRLGEQEVPRKHQDAGKHLSCRNCVPAASKTRRARMCLSPVRPVPGRGPADGLHRW